jgi:hypothetical protein
MGLAPMWNPRGRLLRVGEKEALLFPKLASRAHRLRENFGPHVLRVGFEKRECITPAPLTQHREASRPEALLARHALHGNAMGSRRRVDLESGRSSARKSELAVKDLVFSCPRGHDEL